MPTDLLFTYGTLMRGFRLHRLLDRRAAYLGPGQVAGRIVDLGSYPGAVPDPGGRLHGELYRVADPALWGALDSAEGPQYHRREVTVRSEDGREQAACIYWYIGPLDRGVPIPSGDYRAHAPASSIYHQPSP
ncbi:MAG TPA: gamma-glutamylcyclotransferase family protein [Patescibacteria group bacterium]|nr:gamma-glutamylcyclotransferase family protein [Patescibacteria group bacterium]